MTKKVLILTLLTLATLTASAQWFSPLYPWHLYHADTAKTAVHMSMGSSVEAGFGRAQSLTWAAPSVSYRASERLTLRGGFLVAGQLLPTGYRLHGRAPQSLAPVREGTQVGALWAAAEYHADEHLTFWVTMARLTGYVQPLWSDRSMPADVTDVSGGFAYRFDSGSIMAMHFRFLHDSYGNMLYPPYGHPYYGPLVPDMELYSGPWPF